VLSILVDTAIELTGAERGFVLLDQGGNRWSRSRAAPEARSWTARSASWRGASRATSCRAPAALALDALTDVSPRRFVSIHALAIRSLLAAPLAVAREAAGAIVLDSRRAGRRSRRATSSSSGGSPTRPDRARNARLVDELRRQADEIRRLNEQLRRRSRNSGSSSWKKQSSLEVRFRYDSLVGASPAMQRVYRILDKIVPTRIRCSSPASRVPQGPRGAVVHYSARGASSGS